MTQNKLTLDGKEYAISDELAAQIRAEVEFQEKMEKGPFERVKPGENYYRIDSFGVVDADAEWWSCSESSRYKVANYCTDKEMIEQRALHETLNRLLWRYSETHGGDATWDGVSGHWYISFDVYRITFAFEVVCSNSRKEQGVIYFKDEEAAKTAIVEVVNPFIAEHPEFLW